MKKWFSIIPILAVLLAVNAFAAGSCGTPSLYSTSNGGKVIEVKISCTSDSSAGTVPNVTITETTQIKYGGKKITNVTTVNPSSNYPTTGGAISIKDTLDRQLIGATVGDTISHSTTQSVGAYLSIDRGASQRRVTAPPVTLTTTGSIGNSKTFDYYVTFEE